MWLFNPALLCKFLAVGAVAAAINPDECVLLIILHSIFHSDLKLYYE
jgi:hypothetical protein